MKQSGCEVEGWMNNISKITKREKEAIKKGKSHKERDQISTVPKVERLKRKKKQDMIRASKRRQLESNAIESAD